MLIGDILAEQGQATADTIAASGGRASFVELDVTNPQDWSNAVAQAVGRFGKLDVLVNNAGVSHRTGVEETDGDAWDRVMDVNVKGVFLGIRAAIPEMRRAEGGSMINTCSSVTGRRFIVTIKNQGAGRSGEGSVNRLAETDDSSNELSVTYPSVS